jgi:hypothetical protein
MQMTQTQPTSTIPVSIETASSSCQTEFTSSEIARQWLTNFAASTRQRASETLYKIWDAQLRDIDPKRLDRACSQLMKSWRFPNLPQIGDVRAQLDQADASAFELKCISAWEKARAWNRENWHPDLGVRKIWNPELGRYVPAAKPLSPEIEYAIRAAGGHTAIQNSTNDDLVWRRKTFLEAFRTVHETQKAAHLIGDSEAMQILAKLKAGPERARLKPAVEISPRPHPAPREIAPIAQNEMPRAARELSPDEIEARRMRQRNAVREWRVAHGMPAEFTAEELQAAAAIGRSRTEVASRT